MTGSDCQGSFIRAFGPGLFDILRPLFSKFERTTQAVRERGGGGLVDDAQDVQARDLTGLLRGLTLGVVEVRGNGDDGIRHRVLGSTARRRA